MVDIANPSFDPHNCSIDEKIALVQRSDGLLVDILAGCEIKGNLNLGNCISLAHLPNNKVGRHLYLHGCKSLTHLADGLKVGGHLYLRGCTGLTHLPDGLKVEWNLYLRGCTGLYHYRKKSRSKWRRGVKGNIIWT